MKAYILMQIRVGSIPEVIGNLKRMDQVIEAHSILGPYDIIAVVKAKDTNQMGRLVNVDIQVIPGILETLTCLIVEE
jgi:DNA-binding Lrp family transcriptional regulator